MITGSIPAKEYEFIRRLVYDRSRINLGPHKSELVRSRLQKRLMALGLDSFRDYCQLLQQKEGGMETTALLDAISTNVTYFFREPKHFNFLREVILPRWEESFSNRPRERFRLWSAGCSSGEEVYSLAITLAEFCRTRPRLREAGWEILGTDISTRMIEAGNKAIYREDKIQLPHASWVSRYFQKGFGDKVGYCRVKPNLRSQVRFHHLNLAAWPYACSKRFDVIFCRNVMIYFDEATQAQLAPRLADHVRPGGFIFVGHAEKSFVAEKRLLALKPNIYQRL